MNNKNRNYKTVPPHRYARDGSVIKRGEVKAPWIIYSIEVCKEKVPRGGRVSETELVDFRLAACSDPRVSVVTQQSQIN